MKHHLIVAAMVAGICTIYSAKAQDSTATMDRNDDSLQLPLYHAQELDADLFGSATLGEESLEHFSGSRVRHHALYGGGGGLSYFFLKYVGIGGDFEAETRAHHGLWDSASGNLILRYPIENIGLSPYIYGGGGHDFKDVVQSFGQVGAGLEFRFCRHAGIFVDGRYIFANRSEDYAMVRAGVRLAF